MVQSVFSESLQMVQKMDKCVVLRSDGCRSEGPRQSGAGDARNIMQFSKGEMQSPEGGEEQTQAPVYAGAQPAGKQLGLGKKGHQLGHEKAMCTCGMEG